MVFKLWCALGSCSVLLADAEAIAMKKSTDVDMTPSTEYFNDFALSFGKDIDDLYQLIPQRELTQLVREFTQAFYKHLSARPESSAILNRLSKREFEHLKLKQGEHLLSILHPGSTAKSQFERALAVGHIHEMVGVSLPTLMETYHLYHGKIDAIVSMAALNFEQSERMRSAYHQRLHLNMEAQIVSHARFEHEIVQFLAAFDDAISQSNNLADMMRSCMQVLGGLDGITACLFSRPDAHGVMQIEAEGGAVGPSYAEAMRSQRAPLFETHATSPAGSGPAGCAWRSGQIQVNNSFATEGLLHPWRTEAQRRGFRSSVAVPLLDQSGQAFAVLSLYSPWPGYFGADVRTMMLSHIQQAMSQAVLRYEQTTVIAADHSRTYRQCLEDSAVQMLYQPIVDLRTGQVHRLEALARLCDADGKLLAPGVFLPAFGSAGLLQLFQIGLEQACKNLTDWRKKEPAFDCSVALNLPPDGLTQDAYRNTVFETLARWNLPPSILVLEMLEDKETRDVVRRDARIAEFQGAGIRIAQDDLGSGYSSLLRMDRVPCDHVKIDQSLVRGTLQRPVRALEFIYHLTLLAQGFGALVTVEGLEDTGLMEAAAILGADYGQGYGIARPMPADDVLHWKQHWKFSVDTEHPRTALGALAGYLLWDHKLSMLTDWPELAATFIKDPWLVNRYLEQHKRTRADLAQMLERTQIVALQGHRSVRYKQMRSELIERMGAIWLEERKQNDARAVASVPEPPGQ
jgi:EAL domain-containing protein (putative c-di-GMP-specific phosphodiesterase class I)